MEIRGTSITRGSSPVSMATFSFFDVGGSRSSQNSKSDRPERFYHGFVLGLLVELMGRYRISSNRESGYGRYDVVREPTNDNDLAFILEFKVREEGEDALEETVAVAKKQIEDKEYAKELEARGIKSERIRCYGFAFQGKRNAPQLCLWGEFLAGNFWKFINMIHFPENMCERVLEGIGGFPVVIV